MKSEQFKIKLKEIKNFLIGKEIKLTLITKEGIQKFNFTSLRTFGSKVLELEKIGAGFAFSKVENHLVEKRIITERELTKRMSRGVWSKIHINASTLTY